VGARLLLGVVFFTGGMSKLIPFPGIIGPVWLEGELQPYGLGPYAQFIAWSEALIGLLMFSRRLATVGAIMLVPLIVNILAVTVSLGWQGTPLVLTFFLLLNVYLLAYDWDRLRGIISDVPNPTSDPFGSWSGDFSAVVGLVLCVVGVPLYGLNAVLGYGSISLGLLLLALSPLRTERPTRARHEGARDATTR